MNHKADLIDKVERLISDWSENSDSLNERKENNESWSLSGGILSIFCILTMFQTVSLSMLNCIFQHLERVYDKLKEYLLW